jgi:ribonuclease HI
MHLRWRRRTRGVGLERRIRARRERTSCLASNRDVAPGHSARDLPAMKRIVYVHADESCLGLQFTDRDSPGGAAGLVEFWTGTAWLRRDYWVSEPATTNNRMAIRSAIEVMRLLKPNQRVVFVSDSQYLIKGMREWLPGWMRRGWRRKAGPIENEALWRQLADASSRHQVDWRWIRGHAGHARNEYANDIAVSAARKQTQSSGLVESGFQDWLEAQRDKSGRYMDFMEWQAPEEEVFQPAPALPRSL